MYASVQELRDEGVTEAQASDEQLLARIARSTALIDRWTGRWFEPRAKTLLLDGSGGAILQLGPPIISITEVRLLGQGSLLITSSDEVVDLDQVRIYNRHITSGLTDPDDRDDPKIQWLAFERGRRMPEIAAISYFSKGVQNIQVTGVFGYTDPDLDDPDNLEGVTPTLITYACMQMVVADLPKLGDTESRDEQVMRGRITSLRTRDQSITWSALNSKQQGAWTGSPNVDNIIASYRRPPTLGAV
jgi:hypothetical protein